MKKSILTILFLWVLCLSVFGQNKTLNVSPTGTVVSDKADLTLTNGVNISGKFFTAQTNTSTIPWQGKSKAYWNTNDNFTIGQTGTAGNNQFAVLSISNYNSTTITGTLPVTAFSRSQNIAVSSVQIPPSSIVQLIFFFDGTVYMLDDYGPNDPTLTQLSVRWYFGAGSPAGIVSANPGSFYSNTNGGLLTTLYVKESGTGTSGWVAK